MNVRSTSSLVFCLLFLACAVPGGRSFASLGAADTGLDVATVNGEPVTVREFDRFVRKGRARVFSHFAAKYGMKDHKGFWSTPVDGVAPIDMLRKMAMDECVRVKVQLIMARDKGILDDVSYAAFLKRLDEENRRRKAAKDRGEVIYGPVEYSEDTGFAHWFSLTTIELKRRFAKDDLDIDDETLRKFYDANKEQYKRPDRVTVHALMAGRGDEARAVLDKLVARKRPDESLEDLFKQAPGDVGFHEEVFGDESAQRGEDEPLIYELEAAANGLSPGKVTDVMPYEDGYMVVQCTERKDMGYYVFDDELKSVLKDRFIDREFELRTDSLVKSAEVSVKAEVYKEVKVR
jgi:hypothetical protein